MFGDEPGGPIYRVSNEKREGEFDVLVPDLPEASAFVLYGTPAEARTAGTASKELLGHDFAELFGAAPHHADGDVVSSTQ